MTRYITHRFGRMGNVQAVIPPRPDGYDNPLDACIAFFPTAFRDCPSFETGVEQLR